MTDVLTTSTFIEMAIRTRRCLYAIDGSFLCRALIGPFKGDRNGYRHERSVVVTNPTKVDTEFNVHLAKFNDVTKR